MSSKIWKILKIFILIQFSIEPILARFSFYSKPKHSDVLFVVENFQTIQRTILTQSFTHQIAVAPPSQVQVRPCNHYGSITIEVYAKTNWSQLQYQATCSVTWLFHSEKLIPRGRFELNSRVYYLNSTTRAPYEIYGIKRQKLFRKQLKAKNFSITEQFQLTRRREFDGVQLHVSKVEHPSIKIVSGREPLGVPPWAGETLSFFMFAYMQDYLNFTVQYFRARTWVGSGDGHPSAENLGMSDLIDRHKVDLALSNTGLWPTRKYRFLFPTQVYKELYIFYHPLVGSSGVGNALALQLPVWFCFAGVILITLLSSGFFFKCRARRLFIWTLAVITEQGQREPVPRYPFSARVFIFFMSLFNWLFFAFLSATLVSEFIVQDEIRSLADLIHREYSFGLWEDSILHNSFKFGFVTDDSPLGPLLSKYTSFATEFEGAQEVVYNQKFAFITGQTIFKDYSNIATDLPLCGNMKQLIVPGQKRWGSSFVGLDSEFADFFNLARVNMMQTGIMSLLLRFVARDAQVDTPMCITETPKSKRVNLKEIAIIFEIFTGGLLLSTIIFAIEVMVTLFKKRQLEEEVDKDVVFVGNAKAK